ncbi:hypothetical protein ACU686_28140 [Yinghuangia aomiensis]
MCRPSSTAGIRRREHPAAFSPVAGLTGVPPWSSTGNRPRPAEDVSRPDAASAGAAPVLGCG